MTRRDDMQTRPMTELERDFIAKHGHLWRKREAADKPAEFRLADLAPGDRLSTEPRPPGPTPRLIAVVIDE